MLWGPTGPRAAADDTRGSQLQPRNSCCGCRADHAPLASQQAPAHASGAVRQPPPHRRWRAAPANHRSSITAALRTTRRRQQAVVVVVAYFFGVRSL